jgi:hypothetical protein
MIILTRIFTGFKCYIKTIWPTLIFMPVFAQLLIK